MWLSHSMHLNAQETQGLICLPEVWFNANGLRDWVNFYSSAPNKHSTERPCKVLWNTHLCRPDRCMTTDTEVSNLYGISLFLHCPFLCLVYSNSNVFFFCSKICQNTLSLPQSSCRLCRVPCKYWCTSVLHLLSLKPDSNKQASHSLQTACRIVR